MVQKVPIMGVRSHCGRGALTRELGRGGVQHVTERVRGGQRRLPGQVRVEVCGDRSLRVPQRLGHQGEGYPGGDHQCGGQMPQVVQPHPRQPNGLGERVEPRQHGLRAQRSAVLPNEHQPGALISLAHSARAVP